MHHASNRSNLYSCFFTGEHIFPNSKRKRYIGFIIHSKEQHTFSRKQLINIIRQSCTHLFGSTCDTYGIYLTRFNGKAGVVRCFHTAKQETIQVLQSITLISGKTVSIETVGTSGTIKTLLKKYFNGDTLRPKQ